MKIAFLNDQIFAYASGVVRMTGGAERQQWLLARALRARGWSVTVGVRELLQPHEECLIDGVKFVGIGPGQIFSSWHRFFAAERPDWWYWRCASHLFGFGVAIAKLHGTQSIFAAGLDRDVRVREALYRRPRWWPAYAIGLEWADRILVQHQGQRSELSERWRRKAHLVPSIVAGVSQVIRHGERRREVAWIAALRQVKRPDRLIDIARKAPHVRFVVCGAPTDFMSPRGYGERMVEAFRSTPNIDYRGQVSPERAVRMIGESAALLCTSDEEGFPNTFVEAWVQGTPVVTLKIDPDGLIAQRGLGVVCSGVDQAAMDIADLIAHPEQREAIGARAIDYVAYAHSPVNVVAAFERALSVDSLPRTESNSTPGARASAGACG